MNDLIKQAQETKSAPVDKSAEAGFPTSSRPGEPFEAEITAIKDIPGLKQSLGRLAPEELAELIARFKSEEHARKVE
jgi:hypothetical protein